MYKVYRLSNDVDKALARACDILKYRIQEKPVEAKFHVIQGCI